MNRADIIRLMEREFEQIVEINRAKGHDYSGEEDALSNFKNEAKEIGITPEQVWSVYVSKHWSAVKTYVREGEVASEPIEGRLRDVILYSFLMMGLIAEKRQLVRETYLEEDPGETTEIPAVGVEKEWLGILATSQYDVARRLKPRSPNFNETIEEPKA